MVVLVLLLVVPLFWRAVKRRKDRRDHAYFIDAVTNRGRRPLDPFWSVPERPPNELALTAQDNDHGDHTWSLSLDAQQRYAHLVGRLGRRTGRRPLDLAPDAKSLYPISRSQRDPSRD